jgi:hypothetical protein
MTNDPELDRIVKHATEQAEAQFPKRSMSIKAKITILIAGLLLVANSAIGAIDTSVLIQQRACQVQQTKELQTIRNQDQVVVDNWVNNVTDQILKGKVTPAQLNQIRNDYNLARMSNNVARTQLDATNCK